MVNLNANTITAAVRLPVEGEQSLLKPKVRVFFSSKAQAYIKPETIDLARSAEKIAGREDAEKWGIKDIDRYWAAEMS